MWVGSIYHASADVQVVAAALLVAGFAFTYSRPRLAWLFVLLIWLPVPVSGAVANAANLHPGLLRPHPLYETVVAVVPAALGAMAGAAARWVLRVGHARA